jgi:hypothetical protein
MKIMRHYGCWLAAVLLSATPALAQGPALPMSPPAPPKFPMSSPTVSPYVNLARSGNSAAANYYGIVRPQIDFRNALKNYQQSVNANLQALAAPVDPETGIPQTGHVAVFQNTGGYFNNPTGSTLRSATGGASLPPVSPTAGGRGGAPTPPRRR